MHLLLAQQDKGEHEVFAISDGVVDRPKPAYRSYPERWWLLLTVVLLNLANYSHWVAFPSVTKESYPQVQSLLLRLAFFAFESWPEQSSTHFLHLLTDLVKSLVDFQTCIKFLTN